MRTNTLLQEAFCWRRKTIAPTLLLVKCRLIHEVYGDFQKYMRLDPYLNYAALNLVYQSWYSLISGSATDHKTETSRFGDRSSRKTMMQRAEIRLEQN